jgi:hypothetical protein
MNCECCAFLYYILYPFILQYVTCFFFVLFHLENGLLVFHSNTPLPNVHCALVGHVAWKNSTQTWLFFWIIHKNNKFNLYFFNILFLKDKRIQYVIKKCTTFTIHLNLNSKFRFLLVNKWKRTKKKQVTYCSCQSKFWNEWRGK